MFRQLETSFLKGPDRSFVCRFPVVIIKYI
jgi:hypothetical protein